MKSPRRNPDITIANITTARTVVVTDRFTVSFVPSDTAVDADLADRVRSQIGPLIKRLDLPRIHVMAEGSHLLLHGDVTSDEDAREIEQTVARIEGVESVESHLHVGLLPSDTRPSEAEHVDSKMLAALLQTAESIGISGSPARAAVWGTLSALLEQIPPPERAHLIAHFPLDVATLAKPRMRFGDENLHWQTELELDAAASLRGGVCLDDARVLVPAVISVLRGFVPEEDHDVQSTLHTHLQELWQRSEPTT